MANDVYDDQDTDTLKGLEESFHGPDATESGSQKLETQALENAYNAPSATESGSQKLADANQLRDKEDNAADDTVGNGYRSTTKKAKMSKGWWNKKRAGIAGGVAGILGIGGIGGLGLFSGVVLQPLHLAQTLMHPYSLEESDTENSQHHWLRDLRALKKNDARYTRIGKVGASMADKMLASFSDAGITFSGSDVLGRPTSIEFDQAKFTKAHPEIGGMSSEEFNSWLNDQYGFKEGTISGGKVSISGLKDQQISSIAKTSKNLAANDSLISGLGLRFLKKFWGVNSLFHPLTRATENKIRAKVAAADAKKQSGQEQTPEEGTSSTAPDIETMDEDFNTKTEPTSAPMEAAVDELKETATGGKAKLVSYGNVATGQMLVWGCTLDKGSEDIVKIDRAGTVLKSVAKVTQLIALASQIKNGGDDVSMSQVSGLMSGLKATDQSDKDTGNKDVGTTVWDGGALGVLAGTATPDKDGNVPNDLKTSSKAAFTVTGGGKLKSFGTALENLAFGGPIAAALIPDKCGVGGAVVQLAAGLAEAVINIPDGETGTIAMSAAMKIALSNLLKSLPSALGLSIAEGYAVKQVEGYIADSGSVKALAADAFTGAQGGDLLAYGARASANLAAGASGGIQLASSADKTLLGSAGQTQQQQFQHESFFARTFDVTDTRSLMGKLSMSITPSLSTNTYSLAAGILNINDSLANTFGSLFSRPTSAATSDSWTGDYDWGFPQVGIPSDLLNSDNNYDNAEALGKYLSSVCTDGTTISPDKGDCGGDTGFTTRIKACFGNDLTYSDNLWDVTPEQASSPTQPIDIDPASDAYIKADCANANDGGTVVCKNDDDTRASCIWGRVMLFVNDMHTLKLMDCADGTTDTSSQSCSDEGVSQNTTSSSATTPATTDAKGSIIVGEYNILNSPSYSHNDINYGSDDDRAKLEAEIVNGTKGPAHKPFDILITNEETESMYTSQKKYLTGYDSKKSNEYAIFWNSSKFNKIDQGTSTQWSGGGGWVDSPWVKLQTTDGQIITLTPVHYSSFTQYSYSESNIKKAAHDTLDWVQQQNDGKSIVIFGGDLGDHKDIPAKIFNDSGLVNNSYYMAKNKKATGSQTAPGGADQIYITPISGLTASDWHNPDRTGIIMQSSDHSPTWVTLNYGNTQ